MDSLSMKMNSLSIVDADDHIVSDSEAIGDVVVIEVSKTTLLVFKFRDEHGVQHLVFAADGRTIHWTTASTHQNYKRKIFQLGDFCLFGYAGDCTYGDGLVERMQGEGITIVDAALNYLEANQRFGGPVVVGGEDPNNFESLVIGKYKRQLKMYSINKVGLPEEILDNWMAVGDGNQEAMLSISNFLAKQKGQGFPYDMAVNEARKAICKAATQHKGTGGSVSVVTMSLKDGIEYTKTWLTKISPWLKYYNMKKQAQK